MKPLLVNAVVFAVGVSIGGTIFSTVGLMTTNNCYHDPPEAPPLDGRSSQMRRIADHREDAKVGGRGGAKSESAGCGETTTTTPASRSAFDRMNAKLYDLANEPICPLGGRRPYYSLGDVNDTEGGLGDSDRLLLASLYRNATSVFEFGLGESTHIAAWVGVPRLAGVDSSAVWVDRARSGPGKDHFRFAFADVGELGQYYGRPKNESLKKIPYSYQSGPLNNEMRAFDLYLVDGRYRVATACASFLHALGRDGDDGGDASSRVRVLVHDWKRGGKADWGYWVLEEIADVVLKSELLAVLRLKTNATEDAILRMWERHMWNMR
mmetsp:Transcript_22081/g.47394  ORF Transcript_22081/g.47394 Transcript_22081/m.47394 type:complete len:323 (+) Transcript_22081:156-1124(+)